MRGQDGTIAVETAVIAPVLLLLMLLVVYAGRASRMDGEVRTAVTHAARAASNARDPVAAAEVAEAMVRANLTDDRIACTQLTVTTDTSGWGPGGRVAVTGSCLVSNGDIALLFVPGTRWSTATAVQPIDRHRGGG